MANQKFDNSVNVDHWLSSPYTLKGKGNIARSRKTVKQAKKAGKGIPDVVKPKAAVYNDGS